MKTLTLALLAAVGFVRESVDSFWARVAIGALVVGAAPAYFMLQAIGHLNATTGR